MSVRFVQVPRYVLLLVVILAACSGLPEATPEITPLDTTSEITPLEAIPSAIDQQGNQLEWKEYRDERFGYGLIVPSDWLIYPYGTSVLVNFGDVGRGLTPETWPEGGFKIDIYVTDNTDHLSLEDSVHKYLDDELSGIASIEEGSINNHPGLVVFRSNKERLSDKPHKTFNLLLPGGQFVTISVLPGDGWENPDIKAMLNSFAFPGEEVLIPSTPPTVGWVDLPPIDATDEITPEVVPVDDTWLASSSPELGIHFRFPPLPGEISYEYNDWPIIEGDPSGTLVEWIVAREDEYGKYPFAACESANLRVGREWWFTDISSWYFDDTLDRYLIVRPVRDQPEVEVKPIRVVNRADGMQGIIFSPPKPGFVEKAGISAVLNLPDDFSPKVKAISFYFVDEISLDDIEAVLNSVSLEQ